MFTVILGPNAKEHTEEAYEYYRKISPALAERFLTTLENQYEKLTVQPHHYSFISLKKDIRSIAVPYFPYSIIFEIRNKEVLVIDVHNTHRQPDDVF